MYYICIVNLKLRNAMNNFTQALWSSLQEELERFSQQGTPRSEWYKEALQRSLGSLQELKIYTYNYHFGDQAEEIRFNRELAPPFNATYIYYLRCTKIMDRLKGLPARAAKKDVAREKKDLYRFFHKNAALHQYCNAGHHYLDVQYFVREAMQMDLPFTEEFSTVMDSRFVTASSYRIAQFIAYERVLEFLSDLESGIAPPPQAMVPATTASGLHWTDSKISLTEIAYALKYARAVNDGKAEVGEIAEALGKAFNFTPGNIYRLKQDLYSRRSQGKFLERLRQELVRGLEDSDSLFT